MSLFMDSMFALCQVSTFASSVANCFFHIKGGASKPTKVVLLYVLCTPTSSSKRATKTISCPCAWQKLRLSIPRYSYFSTTLIKKNWNIFITS